MTMPDVAAELLEMEPGERRRIRGMAVYRLPQRGRLFQVVPVLSGTGVMTLAEMVWELAAHAA